MPLSEAWLHELETCGALLRGHFLLSSGLHSAAYVQCAILLEEPQRARAAGADLADRLRAAGVAADSVLAPALGGVVIGHEVAAALGLPFRFVERQGAELTLRRGFALRPGERVVIVEDVVTTGKSTLETAAVARSFGALPVAMASILDRSASRAEFGLEYAALVRLDLPVWELANCPLCAQGSSPVKPGSRPAPSG